MHCKHCGKVIDDDSKYCSYCGGNVENKAEEKHDDENYHEDKLHVPYQQKSKNEQTAGVIMSAILFFLSARSR